MRRGVLREVYARGTGCGSGDTPHAVSVKNLTAEERVRTNGQQNAPPTRPSPESSAIGGAWEGRKRSRALVPLGVARMEGSVCCFRWQSVASCV